MVCCSATPGISFFKHGRQPSAYKLNIGSLSSGIYCSPFEQLMTEASKLNSHMPAFSAVLALFGEFKLESELFYGLVRTK